MRFTLFLCLFSISGACGLIYEIAWGRLLVLASDTRRILLRLGRSQGQQGERYRFPDPPARPQAWLFPFPVEASFTEDPFNTEEKFREKGRRKKDSRRKIKYECVSINNNK